MPTIEISDIDPELAERLRCRAAEHGVSVEEEVLRILARALGPETDILVRLQEHWAAMPTDPGPLELDSACLVRAERDARG